MAFSPFVLGYNKSSGMTVINMTLGSIIASFAAIRALGAYDARTISGINIALAILTLLMPWMMGDAWVHSFLTVHLITGIGVLIAASATFFVSHHYRPIGGAPWVH